MHLLVALWTQKPVTSLSLSLSQRQTHLYNSLFASGFGLYAKHNICSRLACDWLVITGESVASEYTNYSYAKFSTLFPENSPVSEIL